MSVPRRLAALLAMVAAVLGVVLVAPSAQAETPQLAPPSALADPVTSPNWTWTVLIGNGNRDTCPQYYVCLFTGTNFRGFGLALRGNVIPGDWATWFDTSWQDSVHSAVNKGTIPIHLYDIHGSAWTYLGSLLPGYDFQSGWPGAGRADGLQV